MSGSEILNFQLNLNSLKVFIVNLETRVQTFRNTILLESYGNISSARHFHKEIEISTGGHKKHQEIQKVPKQQISIVKIESLSQKGSRQVCFQYGYVVPDNIELF